MNHPTKHLLQYICEEINSILKIPNSIDYDVDPLNNPRCVLYECLQPVVNFNVNDQNILTNGINDTGREQSPNVGIGGKSTWYSIDPTRERDKCI